MHATETRRWRLKGPEMEGLVARWYARIRHSGSQLEAYRKQAFQFTQDLQPGSEVLEVAFGPGYLAIEMARPGRLHVTGLDISRSFVAIASENAQKEKVSVDFRWGDSAVMPFAAESFDLVVCQAAFKNFVQPGSALSEMYRVLRDGGTAVIQDMSSDATHAAIEEEVKQMELGPLSAFMTKGTLEMLKRRAYSPAEFERLAAESPFKACEITTEGIGLEVRLTRQAANPKNHDS
jgi:ubiquinone/menaquinone biosynthesis C-methylase UbiE